MVTRIWFSNSWHNIKPEKNISNMRQVNSFCIFNQLRNALFKAQGGYYILNMEGNFEFLERRLQDITYQTLYNLLKEKG